MKDFESDSDFTCKNCGCGDCIISFDADGEMVTACPVCGYTEEAEIKKEVLCMALAYNNRKVSKLEAELAEQSEIISDLLDELDCIDEELAALLNRTRG